MPLTQPATTSRQLAPELVKRRHSFTDPLYRRGSFTESLSIVKTVWSIVTRAGATGNVLGGGGKDFGFQAPPLTVFPKYILKIQDYILNLLLFQRL